MMVEFNPDCNPEFCSIFSPFLSFQPVWISTWICTLEKNKLSHCLSSQSSDTSQCVVCELLHHLFSHCPSQWILPWLVQKSWSSGFFLHLPVWLFSTNAFALLTASSLFTSPTLRIVVVAQTQMTSVVPWASTGLLFLSPMSLASSSCLVLLLQGRERCCGLFHLLMMNFGFFVAVWPSSSSLEALSNFFDLFRSTKTKEAKETKERFDERQLSCLHK